MVLAAVNVRVIHLQGAHAQKAGQRAGKLVAVDRAILGQPHRQFAVAARLNFVNQMMMRAVHAFEVVGAVVHFHGRIHIMLVIRQMSGGQIQFFFCQMRRGDALVAILILHLFGKFFYFVFDNGAVGQPHRQTLADHVINEKNFLLPADFSMIALFRLGEHCQMFVQFFFARKRHAINALDHFVFFAALPVRAGDFN